MIEGQSEGVGGTNSSDTALEDLWTYGLSTHQLRAGKYRPKATEVSVPMRKLRWVSINHFH